MTVPIHQDNTSDHHIELIGVAVIVAALLAVASLTIFQASTDGGGGTSTELRTEQGSSVVETFSPEKARAAQYQPKAAFPGGTWELPDVNEVRAFGTTQATDQSAAWELPDVNEVAAFGTTATVDQSNTGNGHPDIRTATVSEARPQTGGNGHPDIRTATVSEARPQTGGNGHPDIRTASEQHNPNAGSNAQ